MPKRKDAIVLQVEGKHPGYTDYLFISTETGLRSVADSLVRLTSLSNGARIDFRIGDAALFGHDGHLSFAKCSEEKLTELLDTSLRPRKVLSIVGVVCLIAVFGVGVVHSLAYFARFIAWVAIGG